MADDEGQSRAGWWRGVTRDTVLFVVGLLGIAHETLSAGVERPVLLAAFLAMMGLPMFLRADERGKGKGR